MALQKLTLRNFRNHAYTELLLAGRNLVLFGANGSGKTNVLDAVSLLSPGRGMRRSPYVDMLRKGHEHEGWGVEACFTGHVDEGITMVTGVRADQPSKRLARLNGSDVALNTFAEVCGLTWLTPRHDRLFLESAAERRRFLDRLVLSVFPQHGRLTNLFERHMRERVKILEMGDDEIWLTAVEEKLADAAWQLSQNRQSWVYQIARELIEPEYGFPGCDVALIQPFGPLITQIDSKSHYIELLKQRRNADKAAGRLLIGPHRADLAGWYREKLMPAAQCSTGEQKALLVSILIAHIKLLRSRDEYLPILVLLDEIGAHFDPSRRKALASVLLKLRAQAFLTGTEEHLFSDFGSDTLFVRLEDGKAYEC